MQAGKVLMHDLICKTRNTMASTTNLPAPIGNANFIDRNLFTMQSCNGQHAL